MPELLLLELKKGIFEEKILNKTFGQPCAAEPCASARADQKFIEL
jgi:hypothetical protein